MALRRVTHWIIACDGDCGEEAGGGTSRDEAAAEARRLGWHQFGREWVCPACLDSPVSLAEAAAPDPEEAPVSEAVDG